MTLFSLITSLKTLFSKYSHILRFLGLELQHMNGRAGRAHNSVDNIVCVCVCVCVCETLCV